MRKTDPVKRKESFTAEKVTTLMELLTDNRIGWSIRLFHGTGMRSQELLTLQPRHIEPDSFCIHIRQAINMIKGTAVVGTPKSRDSYRDVPVPLSIRQDAITRFSKAFTSKPTDPDKPTDGVCKVLKFPKVR